MSERNTVVLVDAHDKFIGIEDKLIAHQKGLLHRAFSVMLYKYNSNNKTIKLLLQKRAKNKYHCAGLWTNTCCSHPGHPGFDQDIIQSCLLRLKEELIDIDINNINLKKIGSFVYRAEFENGLIEHEYDHVFAAEYKNTPSIFNQLEIEELAWVGAEELKQDISDKPNKYTPWLPQVLKMCLDNI